MTRLTILRPPSVCSCWPNVAGTRTSTETMTSSGAVRMCFTRGSLLGCATIGKTPWYYVPHDCSLLYIFNLELQLDFQGRKYENQVVFVRDTCGLCVWI